MIRLFVPAVACLLSLALVSTPAFGDDIPQFVLKWGSEGSGDGQFNFPIGVAVDHDGNVYVAENGNTPAADPRMQKFTSDGVFLLSWGAAGTGEGEFSQARGCAFDSTGNVYVVDNGGRIQKFTSEGFLSLSGVRGAREMGSLNDHWEASTSILQDTCM